jgi:hypothetical protein
MPIFVATRADATLLSATWAITRAATAKWRAAAAASVAYPLFQ